MDPFFVFVVLQRPIGAKDQCTQQLLYEVFQEGRSCRKGKLEKGNVCSFPPRQSSASLPAVESGVGGCGGEASRQTTIRAKARLDTVQESIVSVNPGCSHVPF